MPEHFSPLGRAGLRERGSFRYSLKLCRHFGFWQEKALAFSPIAEHEREELDKLKQAVLLTNLLRCRKLNGRRKECHLRDLSKD